MAPGPGTALRQYLALPTQEMRPGAAASWARTTKERAAVPKLPGSVAILPVSAARVPAATPLLAAAAAGLARQTGGPARASVEMRGPSSNSATMGLTAQQRAVAKTSSRTPSPGHRPPVPVGQGRGAVHRLTTGPGFLPTSQATVRQSWPDAQPGEVVSREQPRLPRHHELGLTPSPLVPGGVRPAHVRAGRVRVGRGGPTSAIRTGGRLPSRGSSAMVPVADAVSAGRMGAGLPSGHQRKRCGATIAWLGGHAPGPCRSPSRGDAAICNSRGALVAGNSTGPRHAPGTTATATAPRPWAYSRPSGPR